MERKKKIIIISVAMILLIGILVLGFFMIRNITKDKDNKLDTDIVSIITLDINPSIKLELNKEKLVVNVISLNNDGKEIIEGNYLGKKLEDVVNGIIDKLVDKGYAEEELVILVGFSGDIKEDLVKEIIDDKLNTLDVQYNIIIPEINETSEELANKYNITESKAAYLEDIIEKYTDIKIDDIKDMSIKDIEDIVIEKDNNINKENDNSNENATTNNANNNANNTNTGGGYGSLEKCAYVKHVLTNEEAGKKIASLMGASVGTGQYCDKLPPESVVALTSDGTCAYRVTFAHRTQSCVYYVGVETGNILGNPSCSPKTVGEGEAQCIIMESMGITAREQFYASNLRDTGSEWVYDIEDVYGVPDENGKRYVYEYHVSKSTGEITSKTIIRELQ